MLLTARGLGSYSPERSDDPGKLLNDKRSRGPLRATVAAMPKPDLNHLEARVDELIALCASLRAENQALRTQQSSLMSERAALIEKSELARTRVEAMIARLKSMEAGV